MTIDALRPTRENAKDALTKALDAAISEWPLADHPFLTRFAAGEFSRDAIRWFAIKMLPGSNRFNQAFLEVAARVDDYRARILLLNNIYSEHGNLDPDQAHVALFMRFMRGIGCDRIDVHEDDGAFWVPELRFKRFEIQDNEPVIWSLGRFAAIECVLPGVFTKYIDGLHKVFPELDDHTIEYFPIHCELDPDHTDQLLRVAGLYARSDRDIETFADGVRDMLISMSDMFTWMGRNMAAEAGNDRILRAADSGPTTLPKQPKPPMTACDFAILNRALWPNAVCEREAAFVAEALGDRPSPAVLDLGSPGGGHTRALLDRGIAVTSAEPESAEVTDTSGLFDAVLCLHNAIHRREEPQDVVRLVRLARGRLRRGGVLILELTDRLRMPENRSGGDVDGVDAETLWRPGWGVFDSDLVGVCAGDAASGRHVLEVENLFHTDPFRIANWVRLVGLSDVVLRPGFDHTAHYDRSADTTGRVVLVARASA